MNGEGNTKYEFPGDQIVTWALIFEMLSIEPVKPFLPEMGLAFLDADLIRTAVRDFIPEIREFFNDANKTRDLLVQDFLIIERRTSTEVASQLYGWGKWIYISGKRPGLFPWDILLTWVAGLYSTHVPVVYPLIEQEKLDAIIQSIKNNFSDEMEIYQKIEDAELLPRSQWDKYISLGSESYYPLTFASTCITDYKVQRCWNTINLLLTRTELEVFLKWAKENSLILQLTPDVIELPNSFS